MHDLEGEELKEKPSRSQKCKWPPGYKEPLGGHEFTYIGTWVTSVGLGIKRSSWLIAAAGTKQKSRRPRKAFRQQKRDVRTISQKSGSYVLLFLNPCDFAMRVFLASSPGSEVKHFKGRACVIIFGEPHED